MEQLDPTDLLIFARVAEAGSFSRAAERIGLPKSTVSRRVSQLEEQLGERLMLRTTRRLALTEFGQQVVEHARQVAAEVDAAKALAENRQARPSGRLRVSMPGDFAAMLLPNMLTSFMARHPAISLELDVSPRRVDLLAENFDLAVRMGELPDDAQLVARRIATLASGLYAAPDYLSRHGDPAMPEDILRHDALRVLARNGEPLAWTLAHGKQRWEGVPPGRIAANTPELLVNMARAGAGIVAVPDYIAAPSVRRGELRRVLPEWRMPSHTVWVVFPGRRLVPAKTRAFIDMLEAALAEVLTVPD